MLERGRVGETYNVGGLCERRNIEVVDRICDLIDELAPRPGGKSCHAQKTFVRDRPGHDRRYAIDCSKLTAALGWKPAESFETGIRKTVAWYLDHRDWCERITSGTYRRERLGTGALA